MVLAEQDSRGYEEREINFRETVPEGTGVRVTQSLNFAGKITKVMMHFPDGCNALVEMKLEKDYNSFYPINGTLALNGATPVYHTSIDYYRREPLTLSIENKDSVNPHTVTCTVVIRFEKPDWWDM